MISFDWMMIALPIFLILLQYLWTKVVQPYRQFKKYVGIISAHYKTLVHPYNVFGLGTYGRAKKDYLQHNDSHFTFKTIYCDYQVSLSSFKGKVFIDLIDPELIKEYYERNLDGCYEKYTGNPFMSSIHSLVGNGLLFSEGEQWKNKRRIMSSVFNYDFIKSKIRAIVNICEEKIEELQNTENNKGINKVKIDVNNLFQRIYGNVVIKCFFGDIKLDKIQNEEIFTFINGLMEQNTERSLTKFAFIFGSEFYKYQLRKIDKIVNRKINCLKWYANNVVKEQVKLVQEKKNIEEKKFVGVIQKLVRENKLKQDNTQITTKKDYYTITDLIDQFVTFFMAGTDTTSNMATVLVYMLARYPQVGEKVRKQIQSILNNNSENITYENLKKMVYLENVQKQTLRMYGPTAGIFTRNVIKDHFIGSIPVKKDMIISVKIKSNHFKKQFYEDPQTFNPDRWVHLDSTKTEPYSYFPFSSGQRNCIGQHLAMLQSKIAVAMIVIRYKNIILQNPSFKMYMLTLYGAEHMITTFEKQ